MSAERGRRRRDVRYVIISHSHASSVTHTTHTRAWAQACAKTMQPAYPCRGPLAACLLRHPPSRLPGSWISFATVSVRLHRSARSGRLTHTPFAQKRSQRAPHSHTLPRFAFCNTGMRSSLARLLKVPPPRLDLPDIFAEPTAPGSRTGRRHHGGPPRHLVFLSRTFGISVSHPGT